MIAIVWFLFLTLMFVFLTYMHKKRLRIFKNEYEIVLTMPSFFLLAGAILSYVCVIVAICSYFENITIYVSFLVLSILSSVFILGYYACYVLCNEKEIVKITWFFKCQEINFSDCDGYYLDNSISIFSEHTSIRISNSMKNYIKLAKFLYSKIPELENKRKEVRIRKFKDSVYEFQTYVFLLILDVFLCGVFIIFAILAPTARGMIILFLIILILWPILLYISVTRAHSSTFWDKIARVMVKGEALKPFVPTVEHLASQIAQFNIVEFVFCGNFYKIIRESQFYSIYKAMEDDENNIFSGSLEQVLHYNLKDEKSLNNSFSSCKILHIY